MEKNTLLKWKLLGWTVSQMSEECGKGQSTIRYWLSKYNLIDCKKYLCASCGETDESKFRKDGTRYTECKSCHTKKHITRLRQKKDWAVSVKGGKCERCGYSKCNAALEFHHKNPSEKDEHYNNFRGWSKEKILKEIEKCELVCSNCHREQHYMGL